ncbi:hypothetical protein, partial [Streptomyces sp. FH025]|uniref:hypothetical protein n=1 Tax=Streptomyces sp. FH025 TaxID=2815937 RepID=UPI001A9FB031
MGTGQGQGRRVADLLECWRAIELFSPPTIPEVPRKRRAGRPRASDPIVVDLTPAAGQAVPVLPWASEHPETAAWRAPRGMVWRHEVYGGVFDLELLRQAMIAVLPKDTDPNPGVPDEELVLSGKSAMFALVLDEHGRPVDGTSVVSACAWATGRLFDPGPSAPGWLDGFEELGEAFEVAVGQLAAAPITYTAGQRPQPVPGRSGPYGLPVFRSVDPAPLPEDASARGWQQLLAQILGAAAVAAVGALFGEVAGAAVQGATEPLVRRVSDWVAARRPVQDVTGPQSDTSEAPEPIEPVPTTETTETTEATEATEAPDARSVALADLVALTAQIAHLCGVQDRLDPRMIRVRSRLVHLPRDPEAKPVSPQPFLNSLLPPDLALVRAALKDGKNGKNGKDSKGGGNGLGPALDAYLTARSDIPVHTRTDLRQDRPAVLDGVAPALVPAGRWPAKARHPLALSQQFAVNRILADRTRADSTGTGDAETDGGLFSVNGPPGTGKTTMLRDLVAALVVERATVMASLKRPDDGFVGRAWRGKDRQSRHQRFVAALDPRLTGYEIVVTSSNNGAVENVTAELPGASALDEHWHDGPDHFSDLASALLGGEPAWGLVAAVLGNKGNRTKFAQRFWWGRLPEDEADARTAQGLAPLRGMNALLADWTPPGAPRPARTPRSSNGSSN